MIRSLPQAKQLSGGRSGASDVVGGKTASRLLRGEATGWLRLSPLPHRWYLTVPPATASSVASPLPLSALTYFVWRQGRAGVSSRLRFLSGTNPKYEVVHENVGTAILWGTPITLGTRVGYNLQ